MHAHSLDCVLHCVGPPCSHRSMTNASPCSRSRSHGRRTRPRTGSRSKSPPSAHMHSSLINWPPVPVAREGDCAHALSACLSRTHKSQRQTLGSSTSIYTISTVCCILMSCKLCFTSCTFVCYISALTHTHHPVIGRRFRWREGTAARALHELHNGRRRSLGRLQFTLSRLCAAYVLHTVLPIMCMHVSHISSDALITRL